jgi:hypothetical protein
VALEKISFCSFARREFGYPLGGFLPGGNYYVSVRYIFVLYPAVAIGNFVFYT